MLNPRFTVSVALAAAGGALTLTTPDSELSVLLFPFLKGEDGAGGTAAQISTDPAQSLREGTDGRLYVPAVGYTHTQTAPLDTWVINHNLGENPNIMLISTGGREMWAEVIHTSLNQAVAYFESPLAGKAICS